MPAATFEEKQHEFAANQEIALGAPGRGSHTRPAGQVLEGILGYETAAQSTICGGQSNLLTCSVSKGRDAE
jgi:hypothetical protein